MEATIQWPRSNRGGSRPGAGRPPTTQPIQRIALNAEARQLLAEYATYVRSQGTITDQGSLASQIIAKVVRELMLAKK